MRRLLISVAGACLALAHGLSVAAPEGGNIVSGSGSIDKEGSKTTINQYSPDIVVDWDSFNVTESERVHFEQSSTSDSALNRIYDANPSEIWGKVTARGNVWLLNPNGVFFSRTSQVAVGSLVAAGLWMGKDDFMRGRYVLSAERGVGNVSNAGAIAATNGGVALLGGQVRNSGSIRASASRVTLASGDRIAVAFDGDGLLRFQVDSLPDQGLVSNDGMIEAGEIAMTARTASGVFAGVVNNGGVLRASNVDGSGGVVRLSAGQVEHSGSIDASATTAAAGGRVSLEAGEQLEVTGAITVAAIAGIDIDPVAMRGGVVELLGQSVLLTGETAIDASGRGGGGTVLVGGDWQGANPQVRNADAATVEQGARILANATEAGDGGTVVVWSDGTTRFHGEIEARGGATRGDGGQVEVSGKQHLLMRGTADTRAPKGETGQLLLDPGTVTICAAATCTDHEGNTATHDGMNVWSDAQILSMLDTSNVTIATSDSTNNLDEDITINSGVSIAGTGGTTPWDDHTLTLTAGNNITLGGTLTPSGSAALVLNFGNMLSLGSATLSGSISAAGSGAASILEGPAGDTTWTVNGDSVTVDGVAMSLTDIGILRGGAGVDTFNVTGPNTSIYNLEGMGGADIFTLTGALTGSIDGGDDGDTFTLDMDGSVSAGIDGGAGADTFTLNTGSSVTGGLTGGAGDDTFDFNGGTVTGTVAGDAGSDTIDFADVTNAVTVNLTGTSVSRTGLMAGDPDIFLGFDGSVSGGAMFSFTGVDDLTGTGVSDTLQGIDAASTWNLGAADSYVIEVTDTGTSTMVDRTLMFSSFESFTAGSAADTFVISRAYSGSLDGLGGDDIFRLESGGSVSGSLTGGAGDDTFDFNGGTVSGTVAGGADSDTLDFTDTGDELTITMTGSDNTNGFTGSASDGATFTPSFSGINELRGSSASDTLVGRDVANTSTWTVTSYNDGTATLGFSSVENLQGGSGVDEFTVSAAHRGNLMGEGGADTFTLTAELDGSIDGGDDDDTFTLNNGGSVTMGVMGGDGADTFNINNGGSVAMGITGGADGDTFNLNGGSVSGGLTGGTGDDIFDFNGGTVTGTVAGGADSDTLDFTDTGDELTITMTGSDNTNGFTGSASDGATFTPSFSGINELRGSSASDTLVGRDVANTSTWTVTSYNDGTATLGFSSVENLQGGSGVDEFTVSAAHRGNLMGGGGADTFTLTAELDGSIDGGDDSDIFTLNNGGSVTMGIMGGDGADTFNINNGGSVSMGITGGADGDTFNLNNGGSVSGGLTGGTGDDTFDFNGGTVTGAVAGGGDSDTLDFTDTGDELTITVTSSDSTNGFTGSASDGMSFTPSFSGINELRGSSASDTLVGRDIGSTSTWTVASYNDGTATLGFSSVENLQGGSGVDEFTVSAAHRGNLMGGRGADTFTLTAELTGSIDGEGDGDTFTLNNGGSVTMGVMGGDGADIFNINNGGSVAMGITGGAGGDTFNLNGGSVSGGLTGGAGDDTFDFNGGTVTGTVAGGANSDTIDFADLNTALTIAISTTADDDGHEVTVAGVTLPRFTGIDAVVGGGGTDTISGPQLVNSWRVTGTAAGIYRRPLRPDFSFSSVESIQGATSGSDTLDLSDVTTPNALTIELSGVAAAGFGGTVSGTAAPMTSLIGFSNINTITGGGGTDTLVGLNSTFGTPPTTVASSTWNLGNMDNYVVRVGTTDFTLNFSAIENLQGGSGADTFNVGAGGHMGNLMGGGGADIFTIGAALVGLIDGEGDDDRFNLNSGGSVSIGVTGGADDDTFDFNGGTVAGTVAGGAGDDTIDLDGASATTAATVALTGSDSTNGFDGTVSGAAAVTFTGANTLTGTNIGSMSDTVTGIGNMDATWTTGSASDSYAVGMGANMRTLTLNNFENFQGGGMVDTFNVSDAHTGDLMGGGGDDVFNIDAALSGSISGEGNNDTFNLNMGGSVSGGLTGGAGNDTFDFDGGTVSGTVAGGGDSDTLDFADIGMALTMALTGSSGNGFGGSVMGGVSVTFSGINEITSGSGDDTLTGLASGEWTLGTNHRYTSGGRNLAFSAIENLQGGSGIDEFTVSADHGGNLMGGGGADTFTLSAELDGSIDGEGEGDTFTLNNGGSVTMGVMGGDGADIFNINNGGSVTMGITGGAGGDTFNLNGGSVSGGLTGGAGDDTFDFNGGTGTVTGTVAGGTDSDTLNLADISAALTIEIDSPVNAEGHTVTVTGVTLPGFTGIDVVVGGSGADTISGPASTVTWAVTGAAAGTYRRDSTPSGLAFSSVENIQGATATTADTLDLSGVTTPNALTIALSGAAAAGFDGTVSGTAAPMTRLIGFSNINIINGATGTDTLTGIGNMAAAWNLVTMGMDRDSYAVGMIPNVFTLMFSAIENLQGGGGVDTFTVGTGGHIGNLMGGGGADIFTIDAALSGSIDGGADGDTFNLNSSGSVSMGIMGGAGTDTFNFNGGRIMGTAAGGDDDDTFSFAGVTSAVTVALSGTPAPDAAGFAGSVTGVVTFTGANELTGTGMTDTVTGIGSMAATWTTGSASDSYAVGMGPNMRTLTLNNFENFQGGGGIDTFNVNDAHTGDLMGGGGDDVFNIDAMLSGSISGEGNNDTFNLNMGGSVGMDIDGGAGNDVFNLNTGGSVSGGLTGGAGNDTFDFDGGTVSGTVAGGGDSDTLDFADIGMALTMALTGSSGNGFDGSVMGGASVTFSGVNEITSGSADTDSLTGLDARSTWTLESTGNSYASGGLTLDFSAIENLQGGSMGDTFTVSADHSGNLMGGGNNDVFTVTAALTGSISGEGDNDTFNLSNGGSATMDVMGGDGADTFTVGTGGYTSDLIGGDGNDVFNIDAELTGLINGEAGEDTFDFNGGAVSAGITGGADNDTLNLEDIGGALTVTLTDSGADGFEGRVSMGLALDFFSGIDNIIGGAATGTSGDTLAGLDMEASWGLDGSNTYEIGMGVNMRTLDFSGLENLTGGSDEDTFTVSVAHGGNLMGGDDADTFTIGAALTGSIDGGADGDTFNLNSGGRVSTGIMGGAGGDTFNFNGGRIMGTAAGGADDDTFSFAGVTSAVTVALSSTPAPDAAGFAGSVTNVVTFTGANVLVGTTGMSDTLQGLDEGATWTTGAMMDSYAVGMPPSVRTLMFSAIENMQGGSGIDTFNVGVDHTGDLMGGGGADVFNIDAAVIGVVSGDAGEDTFDFSGDFVVDGGLSGGADEDTLNLEDISDALTVSLTQSEANGYRGTVAGGLELGFFSVDEIVGGGGDDTLTGLDAMSTWTLGVMDGGTVMDRYSYASGGRTLGFTAIENLTGGAMGDTFIVNRAHTGNLMGGNGANEYTLNEVLTGSVTGGSDTDKLVLGVGGDIETGSFDGGAGSSDEIEVSTAGDDDWTVDGGTVSVASASFSSSNVEILRGDGDADTFNIANNSNSDYSIEGGTGANVITYDGTAWDINSGTVTLGPVATPSMASTLMVNDVETLRGGANADTFNIRSGSSRDYNIDGMGDDDIITYGGTSWGIDGDMLTLGASLLTLTSVEILRGGGGNDIFTIAEDSDSDYRMIDGGSGAGDIIAYEGTAWNINGGTLTLGMGAMASELMMVSGVEILQGSSNSDTFTVQMNSDSDYTIDGRGEGAGGADVITYTGTSWRVHGDGNMVDLDNSALVLRQVETLQGGASADTFTVQAATALNLLWGGGDDTLVVNTAGALTGTIDGEGGSDTLNLGSRTGALEIALSGVPVLGGDGFSGRVTGGADLSFDGVDDIGGGMSTSDRLTGLDREATWTLGTADSYVDRVTMEELTFSHLENMQGGSAADTFDVNGAHTGNIDSGGGADVFTVSDNLGGSISTAGGADRVTVASGGTVTMSINTGDDGDTVSVSGTVSGGVDTGGGADMVTVETGGTVSMSIDTGAGGDTVSIMGTASGDIALGGGGDTLDLVSGSVSGDVTGGDGDDTFDIDGGTIAGALAGSGGTGDRLDLSGISTAMQLMVTGAPSSASDNNGFSGSLAGGFMLTSFAGMNRIDGGSMSDSMTVSGSGGTYTIVAGVDTYVTGGQTLSFDSWEDLQAGDDGDTFNVNGAHTGDIMTGDGADTVTVAAMLDGALQTEAGGDMVTVAAGGTVSMSINTGDDGDTVNIMGTASSGVDTGSGVDMVTVSGGSVTSGVMLGTEGDTFTISAGSVDGGIVADAGDDTINITGGTVTGGIDTAAGTDTVTISGGMVSGAITTAAGGDTIAVSGGTVVNDIDTGGDDDEVTVSGTGTISGAVDLGGEDDALMVSGGRIGGNVDAGDGVDGVTVSGGSVAGSVTLGAGADTYTISGGSVGMGVTGGAGDDTFNIEGGTTSGTVAGDGDDDHLNFGSIGRALTINLSSSATEGFSGDGGDGGALAVDFSGIDTLTGGTVTDLLNGLAGDGAYTLVAGTGTYDTYVTSGDTLRFDGIEDIQGGAGGDDFIVDGAHGGNLMGGGGANTFTLAAALTGMITGGNDGNILTVNSGGSVSGGVTFGSGTDAVTVNGGSISGGVTLGDGVDSITVSSSSGRVAGTVSLGGGGDTLTLNDGMIDGDVNAGGGADIFDINGGNISGTVAGEGDDDILDMMDFSSALSFALDGVDATAGFSGNANPRVTGGAFTGFAFSGINEIVGGSGTDLLSGLDADSTWNLGSTYSYESTLTLAFSGLEDMQGGDMDDTFMVAGAMHTGNLMGGGSDSGSNGDTFTIDSALAGSLSGEGGVDTVTINSGGSVSQLVSLGDGADSLTLDGGSIVGGVDAGGGVDTVTVNSGSIEGGIVGGAGADTVTVISGSIEGGIVGGDGADIFDINGGDITGTVNGGADGDTLDLADINMALMVALSGTPDSNGFGGSVSGGYTLDFAGIDTFNSGTGTDQVTGLDITGTWTLAADGSSYVSNEQSLAFSSFENFVGGSGSDTYNINMSHTGDISSGGGSDIVNVNQALTGDISSGGGSDSVNVRHDLTGNVNTGIGGDSVFVSPIPGSGAMITLTGMVEVEGGGTLTVGTGASVTGAVSFGSMEAAGSIVTVEDGGSIGGGLTMAGGSNLVIIEGGSVSGGIDVNRGGVDARDSLELEMTGGSVAGGITGGGGDDYLRFSGGTISGDITLRAGTDTLDLGDNSADAVYRLDSFNSDGFSGSLNITVPVQFSGVVALFAGTGTDTLHGLDDPNAEYTWTDSDYTASGASPISIGAMENLIGGSGVDTFTISRDRTGNIEGGGGNDMFTINAVVTGNVHGDSSADASATGDDSFVLGADSRVTGGIAGGMGTDTFTAPDVDTSDGTPSTYMLTAMGVGSYSGGGQTQAFSGIENINAGSGDDTVTVADGAGLAGRFNGNGGSNRLDFSAYTTAVTLTVMDLSAVADSVGYDVMVTPFTGGAGDINGFVGGMSNMDALRGIENDPNVVSEFGGNFIIRDGMVVSVMGLSYAARDITNPDRFTGRNIEYESVEILAGGAAEDIFDLEDAGLVDGGRGIDALDFTQNVAVAAAVTIDGVDEDTGYSGSVSGVDPSGMISGVDLRFEGIDIIRGSSFSDSITGMTAGGLFQVEDEDGGFYQGMIGSGTLSSKQLRYSFVESLIGSSGNDSFVFIGQGKQTGNIDGGGGRDVLDFMERSGRATFLLGVNESGARGQVHVRRPDGTVETVLGRAEETRTIGSTAVTFPASYWTNIESIVGGQPVGGGREEAAGNSIFVVQPEVAGTDLIVNRDKTDDDDVDAVAVMLPDLSQFEGHLFIGGSGITMASGNNQNGNGDDGMRVGGVPFPIDGGEDMGPDATPAGEALPIAIPASEFEDMNMMNMMGDMSNNPNNAHIKARRLIIGGDVIHRSSVVMLGSSIVLEADVAAGADFAEVASNTGSMIDSSMVDVMETKEALLNSAEGSDYSVIAIATGHAETNDGFGEDDNGYIIPNLDDGARYRRLHSGKALIAASATVQDSFNINVKLGVQGGLQFGQGSSNFVFFNPDSDFRGRNLNPVARNYLTVDLNLSIVEFILTVFNPASSLTSLDLLYIDTSLFEEDLTLFSIIGRGVSVYLSMCEEVEGCAPPIGIDVIEQLIASAEQRFEELEAKYDKADAAETVALAELVLRYSRLVRDMRKLKREWIALFAPELGDEVLEEAAAPAEDFLEQSGAAEPLQQATGTDDGVVPPLTEGAEPVPSQQLPEGDGDGFGGFPAGNDSLPPEATIPAPLRNLDDISPDDSVDDPEPVKASRDAPRDRSAPIKDKAPQLRVGNHADAVVSQR